MRDILIRFLENMAHRQQGLLSFRIICQPLMATFFAVRAGLHDAKTGRPPYLFAIIKHPKMRGQLILEGWRSVGRIFILAFVVDVIYQIIEFKAFYPGEALHVALILAVAPYVILRGPTNRIARLAGRSTMKRLPREEEDKAA